MFRAQRQKPPVKEIIRAALLFVVGTVCLLLGLLVVSSDKQIPLLVIGGVCFIPGAYVSVIALNAWRGRPGWEYSQIPQEY